MKTFKDLGFKLDNEECKGKDYLNSDINQDILHQDDYILINLEGKTIEILENDVNANYADFCVLISLVHHADCYQISKFLVSDDFCETLRDLTKDYKLTDSIDEDYIDRLQFLADRDIEISFDYICVQ